MAVGQGKEEAQDGWDMTVHPAGHLEGAHEQKWCKTPVHEVLAVET